MSIYRALVDVQTERGLLAFIISRFHAIINLHLVLKSRGYLALKENIKRVFCPWFLLYNLIILSSYALVFVEKNKKTRPRNFNNLPLVKNFEEKNCISTILLLLLCIPSDETYVEIFWRYLVKVILDNVFIWISLNINT